MDPITRALTSVTVGLKAAAMRWGSGVRTWWGLSLGRTRIDYVAQAGDGRGNSIVVACLAWIGRTLPEAPIQVVRVKRDGSEEVVKNHPLTRLLARPNPYYSGALLLQATASDFKATGNAYWLKARSGAGRAVELWWVPSAMMEPKWPEDDGRVFVSHYEYNPGGTPVRYRVEDVVHFRNGIDPKNPRKGLSEIASLAREIVTDDEAANWVASLLRNMATPSVLIAPDDDQTTVNQEDADRIKSEFTARFGGDNRGAPMVMSAKVKVTPLSFPPSQMDMRVVRSFPEERITATLGVHAAVVGLGTGLANTKVGATMAEMREESYENCIIPLQRLFAAELDAQLLPDVGNPNSERVEFDLSKVRVLQPDLNTMFTRLNVAVQGGWMTPNEAREQIDLEPVPDGDCLYVPGGVTPTDPKELIPPEPEPMALPDPDADPNALPAPAPLRALPPGKSRRERKAAGENLAEALQRVRSRHLPPLEKEVDNYLRSQRARVTEALNRQQKSLNWRDVFDAVSEAKGLQRVLERWYKRVLLSVHALTEDSLGVSFELPDPIVQRYLADAGGLIKDITEHTRSDIARALQEGQAAGEGIPQLTERIRTLTAFGPARATTIARTELGAASNAAALASYEASGVVVGVEVFDSTHDPACAEWAGRRVPLAQARSIPRLGHPNCVRALGAIVDASELEGVA